MQAEAGKSPRSPVRTGAVGINLVSGDSFHVLIGVSC